MKAIRKLIVSGASFAGMLIAASPLLAVETLHTGAVIGSINSDNLAFDGDTATFPDEGINGWAGLDLGEGAHKNVTKIRYFPRAGFPERLTGAVIQGSDSADFRNRVINLHVVDTQPPAGWSDVTTISSPNGFRYIRILFPVGGFNNVGEVEFYGDDVAQDLAPPVAPTTLTASGVSGFTDSQIDLNWADQSTNETHFLIERKVGVDGLWDEIAAVGANVVTYRNVGLDVGTLYYYRVSAFNNYLGATSSDFTNEASLSTTGTPSSPLLVGLEVIGELGGNENFMRARVFDGNTTTYPDANFNGGWAGLDLGAGVFKKVTKIRYFPRPNLPGRMVGAKLQGSDSPTFINRVVTLHEITITPPEGWTTVTTLDSTRGFRYLRILMPNGSYNNVCEVEFYGNNAPQNLAPPAAPTTLATSLVPGFQDTQIDLTWADQSNNETFFVIERKQGVNGLWSEIVAVGPNVTTYRDLGLNPATLYSYRVSSFNNFDAATTSDYSNEVSRTTGGSATSPILEGTVIGNFGGFANALDGNTATFPDNSFSGGWAGLDLGAGVFKNVTKIRYFPRVNLAGRMVGAKFQGSDSPTFSNRVFTLHEITSTPPAGWSVVTTIGSSRGYQYLRILMADGSFNNVNEVEFYGDDAVQDPAAPSAPTALSASPVSGNAESQIDLSWTDGSNNETYFLIERKLGEAGTWEEIAAVVANTTTYRNTQLEPVTLYYYRVSAFNNFAGATSSAYSNEVSLSTTVDATLLAGTAISSAGDAGSAFDGNTSTFFEVNATNAWVGLDLGAGGEKRITKIKFFPRSGLSSRMGNGFFEGSNTADFSSGVVTLYQIPGTPAAGWTEVTTIASTASFRYVRFRASGSNQYGGNPAELRFSGVGAELGPISIPGGALVISGNSASVTIPTSVSGFSYSLFYSDTLQAGSWLPVPGNPKAGGGVLIWTNNITGAPKRFYRMTAE